MVPPSPPDDPVVAPLNAAPTHHSLLSHTIEGGAHFPSLTLDFTPGLNVILGGLGAGKTTSLQSLRYSLGVAATGPRAVANEKQAVGTLGTGRSATRVRTRHGKKYVSQRRCGEEPRVTTGDGEHAPVSLDGDLFQIEMYSQNEILALSYDPKEQLRIIDKLARETLRPILERLKELEDKLALDASDEHRLAREIDEHVDKTRELPTITAALAALTETAGPDAEEARVAHEAKVLRGRELGALRAMREDQRAVLAAADAFEADARRRLGGELAAGLAGSVNRAVLAEAQAQARLALAATEEGMSRVRAALAAGERALNAAGDALGVAHAGQDGAYDALVRRHDLDRGRIAERGRLQRRSLEMELVQKRLGERQHEQAARATARGALLVERARLLAEHHAARKKVTGDASKTLERVLKVDVIAGGNVEEYLALLTDLVAGANVRPVEVLKEIVEGIRPEDLAALVRANDLGPIQAVDTARTNKPERAQRIVDAIRASGRLGELETMSRVDVPVIALWKDEEWVPLDRLSIGQRCTAILPLLLLDSACPLIVDQPEDQIDNAFIFEVFIPTLRRVKTMRQIVFTSHNPNIVVLGNAERVFILESKNRVGRLLGHGTVDEMRGPIELCVEGGREAFLLRSARYGHTTDR